MHRISKHREAVEIFLKNNVFINQQIPNIMKKLIPLATLIVALLATDICVAQNDARGKKREKEECEQFALETGTNPRAAGMGTSNSEAIAFNTAKLQARNELAAQIAAEVTSFMQHRAEQWSQTAGAGTDFTVNKDNYHGHVEGRDNKPRTLSGTLERDSMEIVQKVSQILNNTKPLCHNTYDQPDGSVKVYVCIEMGLQEQRKMYTELKENGLIELDVNNDGQNDVDFNEKEFLLELAKTREEYNAKKLAE